MSIRLEIESDPTLKFWMDSKIDSEHFEHQVHLKCTAIRIALIRSLDKY
jgi:hypothetical protein